VIYEYRSYQAVPGRLGDVDARFRDLTIKIFERLGIQTAGFFTATDPDRLVYLLRWADTAERDVKWKQFLADPEWKAGKAASEASGPIVAGNHSEFWAPTSYSALR
jgi:NIPSNAP